MASVYVRVCTLSRTALSALSVHQNGNHASISEVLEQAAPLVQDYVPKVNWIDPMSQLIEHFKKQANPFLEQTDPIPPIAFSQLRTDLGEICSDHSQALAMTGSSFVASILAGVPTALLINPQTKLVSTFGGVLTAALVGLPVITAKRTMEQNVLILANESDVETSIKKIFGVESDSNSIDSVLDEFVAAFERNYLSDINKDHNSKLQALIKDSISGNLSATELIAASKAAKEGLERSEVGVSKVKGLLSERLGLSTEKEMSIVGVIAMSMLVPALFNVFEVVKVQLQSGQSANDIATVLKDPKVMLKGLKDTILRNLTWNGAFQFLSSRGASFEASFTCASAMSLPHNILKNLKQAGFDTPQQILKEMVTMPGTHRTRVLAAAGSVAAMVVASKVGGMIKELAENPDRVFTELALKKEIFVRLVEDLELPEGYLEALFLGSLC